MVNSKEHKEVCFSGRGNESVPAIFILLQSSPDLTIVHNDKLDLSELGLDHVVLDNIHGKAKALFDSNKAKATKKVSQILRIKAPIQSIVQELKYQMWIKSEKIEHTTKI